MQKRLSLHPYFVLCFLLCGFLLISFWHLDRFPEIHNDEVGIIEPGYNLFTTGIYSSRMYTGYFEREKIYLEVMPVMPILQGLTARLFGVGIFQMRIVPVLAGAIVIFLTYWIAIELTGKIQVGLMSVCLLIFWQLMPAGETPFLGSGIPLVDISRIARYDVVAAAFGLGAFGFWVRGRKTGDTRDASWTGIFAGLSTLTHVYGLIWPLVFWVFQGVEAIRTRTISRNFWRMNGTFGAVLLPWGMVVLLNWPLFVGQFLQRHEARMHFGDAIFYWQNLIGETQRYMLGTYPETYWRAGFWLFLLGVPMGLGWLVYRFFQGHDRSAYQLLLPTLIFPVIFALFEEEKRVYYVIVYFPLFAILLAWGLSRLRRPFLYMILSIIFLQGMIGMGKLHIEAAHHVPPDEFFRALREVVPQSGVVIGPQIFWPAFPDRDYRSIISAGLIGLSTPEMNGSLVQAIASLRPEIILVHPSWELWLTSSEASRSEMKAFQEFMNLHHARLIGSLPDNFGQPVDIYSLDWDIPNLE